MVGLAFGGGFAFLAWRRHRALVVLIGLLYLPGCGYVGEPVIRLSAAFKDSPKLVDANDQAIPITLVVRNDGNRSLRLFKGDGGCSCREVDHSRFPATLPPGARFPMTVRISPGRLSAPQVLPFSFETDHGTFGATAVFQALPRHQLSPEAPSATIVEEGEGWSFDLVHRSITKDGEPKEVTDLSIPPEFVATRVSSKRAPVGGAPKYTYEDETYRVVLKVRGMGLHKAEIRLTGLKRETLATSSPSWKRVPYLSSAPDCLALGVQPMRAFLRCPDEVVELTKVLAAPAGVNAVVSSPREVTVRVTDTAPGFIDGVVEVGTTAANRPPLRIQVVRYAPPLVK